MLSPVWISMLPGLVLFSCSNGHSKPWGRYLSSKEFPKADFETRTGEQRGFGRWSLEAWVGLCGNRGGRQAVKGELTSRWLCTTGFTPAGDPLRKCKECASDCPMHRCKQAVGAPMTLDKPLTEKENQGLEVEAGSVWGNCLPWWRWAPRWAERTMGHSRCWRTAILTLQGKKLKARELATHSGHTASKCRVGFKTRLPGSAGSHGWLEQAQDRIALPPGAFLSPELKRYQ